VARNFVLTAIRTCMVVLVAFPIVRTDAAGIWATGKTWWLRP
jgi:hypothetical protein